MASPEAAQLTQPSKLPDRFAFALNCESNEHYLIQCSSNLINWSTFTHSLSRYTNRAIEYPASGAPQVFFRAVRTNEPVFPAAFVARQTIDLNGNNLRTDSFDSSDPTFSTNGQWDPTKGRDRGDVISNGSIQNTNSNLSVAGRVHTGPGELVNVGPRGSVGTSAWLAGGNQGIQPGYFNDDANVFLPDVVVPSVTWSALPAGKVVNGIFYDFVFDLSGDYRLASGDLTGKILVAAPAVRLLIDGGINLVGQDQIVLATNAMLTIYMDGQSAKFAGAGIVNTAGPTNFVYYGTSRNTSLSIGGNGETIGVFYAPYADVILDGGGSGLGILSGAVVGNSIRLSSHCDVHFDEVLTRGPWK